jgi:uncharacterized membrane protein
MAKSRKVKKKIGAEQKESGIKRSGWFVVILGAAGLGICLYLYSFHIELLMGEIKSGPLCGADNGLGCHSVAAGPYSSMMGLPLASWGAVFYSTLALLGVGGVIFWRDCGRVFLRWAFFLAVFGLAFDLYLAYTMIFQIKAACWLCVATYAINFVVILVLLKYAPYSPGRKTHRGLIFITEMSLKDFLSGVSCSQLSPVSQALNSFPIH